MKNIVIIDGHNLLFRMYYGIPASIKNSKGNEIKGLVGFIGSLKKLINELKPYSLVVVFDSQTSRNNNLTIDKKYKANRIDYSSICDEKNPFTQLPLIKKALEYLSIPYIEVDDFEADDYIASLASRISSINCKSIIVSTDTDFIQLVDDNTFLYVPRGKNSILFDKNRVLEKYNILPEKYVLFKSLVGDKSDNIKGIDKIGSITASRICKYNSLGQYIEININSKISDILNDNMEKIKTNIELITLEKNLDTSIIKFNELNTLINNLKTYEIIECINEK